MARTIDGTFTIKEVMQLTYQYARSRFKYKRRDVVKRIVIKQIKTFTPDRRNQPTVSYIIQSSSYPQYKPYTDGSGRRRQRKVKHEYEVVLQMDRLSLNTKTWKGRLGSQGAWEKRPAQRHVKTIYRETREEWKKRYGPKQLKEEIKKHKERANYLDVGDYNARVKGINGDFLFRCAFPWNHHGHLFGRQIGAYNVPTVKTNPKYVMFFPKHIINVVEVLMTKGILKND